MNERYTPPQIDEGLYTLPNLHAKACEKAVEARYSLDIAKHNLEIGEAAAKLEAKEKNPKYTATEINAYATGVTKELAQKVIDATKTYELAKVNAERLENTFVAIRKAAELLMKDEYMSKSDTLKGK